MDQYIKAAIIGYWRCGASLEHIMALTGLRYWQVERIITDYEKELKNKSKIIIN